VAPASLLCGGSWTPARIRARAVVVVAELTGASANSLYRALTSGD
jgi:hypothetical protein